MADFADQRFGAFSLHNSSVYDSPVYNDPAHSTPTSASHSAEAAVSSASSQQNGRRERRWSRASIRSPSFPPPHGTTGFSRNVRTRSTSFNPLASEFVPRTVGSTKRKASLSAKRSKSASVSSKFPYVGGIMASPGLGVRLDAPITIAAKDLFESVDFNMADLDFSGIKRNWSEAESDCPSIDSELEEAFMQETVQSAPNNTTGQTANAVETRLPRGYQKVRNAMEAEHTRAAENARAADALPKLSVLLIYHGRGGADHASAGHEPAKTRYLPLCSASAHGKQKDTLTVIPSHRHSIKGMSDNQAESRVRWPQGTIPKEMFDLITERLTREDIKSMRLVCKEFEEKVSRSLFYSSVVPFNTELYDMIDNGAKTHKRLNDQKTASERTATVSTCSATATDDNELGGIQWQNAKDDKEGKMYKGHGLKVFQGFGPHIKRFGMSFEVSENQLAQPPVKRELDHVDSFHGTYDWPTGVYARYENLAGLERTADETSRMKAAFSNLTIVQELGLSIDSGLGWLCGLDKSVRAVVLERPTAVFGRSFGAEAYRSHAAKELWMAIQESHRSQKRSNFHPNEKEVSMSYRELGTTPADLPGLKGSTYVTPESWAALDDAQSLLGDIASWKGLDRFGVLYTTSVQLEADLHKISRATVVPRHLTKEQREWLLETEWAQRAFLESWTLAVMDNPSIFDKVTTLTVAKLSSGFLPMLTREAFWDALPSIQKVTLHVKPDWRTVEKDDAGLAVDKDQWPSIAAGLFYSLLEQRLANHVTIEELDIGWVGCGEHAEGVFARNSKLLPAPVTPLEHSDAANPVTTVVFKTVAHLTLTNCWMSPPALAVLVDNHRDKSLKKLTLDSVSLIAHPRFHTTAQQHAANQQVMAQNAMQLFPPGQIQWLGHQQPAQHGIAGQLPPQPAPLPPNAPALGQPPPPVNVLTPAQAQQVTAIQHNVHMQQHLFITLPLPHQPAVPAAPAPAPPAANLAPNNSSPQQQRPTHWTADHREGSWPEVLNHVSPGPIFTDFLEPPPPWEKPLPPRPETALVAIELKSCGYAVLVNDTNIDQSAIEPDLQHWNRRQSPWFRARKQTLQSSMMSTKDQYQARIVQSMPWRELNALQLAWGLTEGWADKEKAKEPEWDGFLPGGTGRVSGLVQKVVPLGDSVSQDA
ncbi:hypothetical protein B0A50_07070 [Salinomyces thailandicus]|uniref:F-box domain-containing protein n=1 Tax=Salinomyces thailandicus TaxID=706561 RepID=A0A4U0TP29_9PEZI|nr:hypothetical protein B0A50_07070 [Salinomyces thailandica]